MERDFIFRILSNSNYPIIYRHDRTIYQQYPELDPLRLSTKCTIAAFAGYWIGKYLRKRQVLFALLLPLPIIAQYIYRQVTLSPALRNYDSLKVSQQFTSKLNSMTNSSQSTNSTSKRASFKTIRKMPRLQSKIYSASDFINQLGPDYFK